MQKYLNRHSVKKINRVAPLTQKEIESGNGVIAWFMGKSFRVNGESGITGSPLWLYRHYERKSIKFHSSWEWLMPVRYKIIKIGAHLKIDGNSELIWWYSPKKTGTFESGAGGVDGWTVKRDPFDAIFGRHYSRFVFVGNSSEKINRETEILATWDNIVYFIKWLKKTCPKLKNHIYERKKN